jgi:putative ABC transport system ATP-binding protein
MLDPVINIEMPVLELKAIEREFCLGHTKIHALRGINLTIAKGDFVAIWGPSGSGKSTLLNLLGLIDTPDRGSLLFEGQDVQQLPDNALSDYRNRKIGFVFQSFNLVPVLTALENVSLPLQILGIKSIETKARASECLRQVGLGDHFNARPDRLSGGQRQRVAIARALVASPSLLIADEPTANLDSKTSRDVIDLIEKLNRDTGISCIFTTHDPRLLARVSRHLKLEDGLISHDTYIEPEIRHELA